MKRFGEQPTPEAQGQESRIMKLAEMRLHSLDAGKKEKFLSNPETAARFERDREHVETLLANTAYWHGTGRFAHGFEGGSKFSGQPTGEKFDVLQSIVSEGIRPHPIWTKRDKSHNATAVTANRVVSRLYAMMNQEAGRELGYTYGNDELWWNLSNYEMAQQTSLADKLHYFRTYIKGAALERVGVSTQQWQDIKSQYAAWISGSTQSETANPFRFRHVRSDIPRNVAVVLGIKAGDYSTHPMDRTPDLATFEKRIVNIIPPEKISYIEVPLASVDQVAEQLSAIGCETPVIPIEFAELIMSERPLHEILKRAA
jgi:hypothetical protein